MFDTLILELEDVDRQCREIIADIDADVGALEMQHHRENATSELKAANAKIEERNRSRIVTQLELFMNISIPNEGTDCIPERTVQEIESITKRARELHTRAMERVNLRTLHLQLELEADRFMRSTRSKIREILDGIRLLKIVQDNNHV